jgi:molybdopterin-guanine dinucleotide biosynthesis protein A
VTATAPVLRGLVLAGGRSQRFGRDKAAVTFRGIPLLERAVSALEPLVPDTRVAVRRDQLTDELRQRCRLLVDSESGIGPAAGILAAHRSDGLAAWLVVACDMPLVEKATLTLLIRARDHQRAATAFRAADGRAEPLCAIYEPATLARFRLHVEAGGDPSPRDWLMAADTALVDPPGAGALVNVNTPEDLRRLEDSRGSGP